MPRPIAVLTLALTGLLAACSEPQAPAAAAEPLPANVAPSPEAVQPVLPGMPAPAFAVRHPDGSEYRFDPASREKPAVLIFYRGGWCPYCNAHLQALRHAEEELNSLGFEVLFLSADRPEKLAASLEEPLPGYTLLSDSAMTAARAYGLAFRVPDETVAKYKAYGIDLEAASGHDHHILPVPAVYLVGTDGLVHFMYVNPNYQVRLQAPVLLAAARAMLGDGIAKKVK